MTIPEMIASAIAAGAAASLQETTAATIKDAYSGLKSFILERYGQTHADLRQLETDPNSKGRRQVLAEALEKANVQNDEELRRRAVEVLEEIKREKSEIFSSIVGVSIEKVRAAAITVHHVRSSGVGVVIKEAVADAEINVSSVDAGGPTSKKMQRR